MRINKFVANATGLSRRSIDKYITAGRIQVNAAIAHIGQDIGPNDTVSIDGSLVETKSNLTIVLLDKPIGYVSSRNGQGAKTIYELLPAKLNNLKIAGRLDKDSSGLMVLTNSGDIINKLSHPSLNKDKIYEVKLAKPLSDKDKQKIEEGQVNLDGKPSIFTVKRLSDGLLEITIKEGRNRQIRRTFEFLDNKVIYLNRTRLGPFKLDDLKGNRYKMVDNYPFL